MKIIHLSDTHNRHKELQLEEGDVIIHSGDATNMGSISEVTEFLTWYGKLSHTYKLFIAGNHDWLFEKEPTLAMELCKENNVTWLNSESIEIDGLKFYGESAQPHFCAWAFNIKEPWLLKEKYDDIPNDTDILITHCPPKGYLDLTVRGEHVGSNELQHSLQRLNKLKLHCFGHIHHSKGLSKIGDTWFSNGAICDEQYQPTNKENVIELDV